MLETGSVSNLKVTNGDIVKQFDTIENLNAPRSARLSKEDKLWTQTYMAIVSQKALEQIF